jgi:hypothetical protein
MTEVGVSRIRPAIVGPRTHPGSCFNNKKCVLGLIELHSNSNLGQVFLMSLLYQPLPAGSYFRLLKL